MKKIILISLFFLGSLFSCNDEKKEATEKEERKEEIEAWAKSYHKYKNEMPLVLIAAKYEIPLENVKKFYKAYNETTSFRFINDTYPDAETEFKKLVLDSGLTEQQIATIILELENNKKSSNDE